MDEIEYERTTNDSGVGCRITHNQTIETKHKLLARRGIMIDPSDVLGSRDILEELATELLQAGGVALAPAVNQYLEDIQNPDLSAEGLRQATTRLQLSLHEERMAGGEVLDITLSMGHVSELVFIEEHGFDAFRHATNKFEQIAGDISFGILGAVSDTVDSVAESVGLKEPPKPPCP